MIPNVNCTISKAGELDIYGQTTMSDPVDAKCAVVRLTQKSIKTSVRADSSASRGTAKEVISDSTLLFPTHTDIDIGDMVLISNIELEVSEIQQRFDVNGVLDHYQVELVIWQSR